MNLSATRYVAPVLVSASLFLAGCGALSGDGAEVNQTRITTAFYPLEYAAERVAGDHFDVDNLTGPGTEHHDLELSVKQTGQVSDARLVIFPKGLARKSEELGRSVVVRVALSGCRNIKKK